MGIQLRMTLKGFFKKGKKPTEAQFGDLIDSFVHKNDAIAISSVIGLQTALNNSASVTQLNALIAVVTALEARISALESGLIGPDGVDGTIKIYKATAPDVGVCIAIFADGAYQEVFNNLYVA